MNSLRIVILFLFIAFGCFDSFRLPSSFGNRISNRMTFSIKRMDTQTGERQSIIGPSNINIKTEPSEEAAGNVDSEEEDDDEYDESLIQHEVDPTVLSKNEIKRRRNAERKAEFKTAFGPTKTGPEPPVRRRGVCLRREITEHYLQHKNDSFSIAIDCTFENIHSDEDLKHLVNQLLFSYACNKKHTHPADLRITGVGPRVHALLEKARAFHWIDTPISNQTYSELDFITAPSNFSSSSADPTRNKTMIYLSPDADYVLTTLDPSCCYIVGGIVDRSVKKYLTITKARQERIPCARLPIKEHFKMGRTALTVNQVIEILLNFGKTQDWYTAMEPVLPKRKIDGQQKTVS